ncbi:uncharacterized protein LOC131875205 [Cryptomeria japonica]|uniref:uncharacterized protein LOC131875205 n=1 Tax=Cryptomeria japonica TaxID=3369 RepID=UPI0027DA2C26|nr:uncharacterized protein LOC131875205 [Cryptomeria japonica]
MFIIVEKLKLISKEVKGWNRTTFGDIFKKKKGQGSRLEQLQNIMATGKPPNPILMEEEDCHNNWKDILFEEVYWKQRSRIQWLKEGDINFAFFHRSACIHKRRNHIKSIKDDSDQEITRDSLIRQCASDFFTRLYTGVGGRDAPLQDSLVSKLPTVVEEEDNYQLTAPIFAEEVRLAIFAMGAYKALDPDGFPSVFFQDYWDIVSYDVTKDVHDIFKTGKLLKKINNTYIVLVPKTFYNANTKKCIDDKGRTVIDLSVDMLGFVFGIPSRDEVLLTIEEEVANIWDKDIASYKRYMNENLLEEERKTGLKASDILRADFKEPQRDLIIMLSKVFGILDCQHFQNGTKRISLKKGTKGEHEEHH